MDRNYQLSRIFGDPAFRRLAHEIVDMAGAFRVAPDVDPEEVHEAIDRPDMFLAEGGDRVRRAFIAYVQLMPHDLSDDVVRRHKLKGGLFLSPPNLFDDSLIMKLKKRLLCVSESFNVSPPSDEELKLYDMPDIAEGATLARAHIASLTNAAIGVNLREYLAELDAEMAELVKGPDSFEPVGARRKIWEVQWILGGAVALRHMPSEKFLEQLGEIAADLRESLTRLSAKHMNAASAVVETIEACLSAGTSEGRVRDIGIEGHIILADLALLDARRREGREPVADQSVFEGISASSFAFARIGQPERAVRIAHRYSNDSTLAGAALLDGAYRYRFRDDDTGLLDIVAPVINRARIASADKGSKHGDASLDAKDVEELALCNRLPALIADGRPIYMEYGGGWSLNSWELAEAREYELVISIDPDPEPLLKGYGDLKAMPPNFIPLVGWAEDVAPFAARGGVAGRIDIIAPPSAALNAMLLSSILAVKPGGFINIFMDVSLKTSLEWLKEIGLDIDEDLIRSDDPTLPPSEDLEKYLGVRHLKIAVHDLDSEGAGRGGRRRYALRGPCSVKGLHGTASKLDARSRPSSWGGIIETGSGSVEPVVDATLPYSKPGIVGFSDGTESALLAGVSILSGLGRPRAG